MALLAAEAVLAVLLLALVVGAAVLSCAERALLAGALELVVDGYVKEVVGFCCAEGRGGTVLALCGRGMLVKLKSES